MLLGHISAERSPSTITSSIFRDPGAIYVNLYVPAEVTFLHDGAKVRLTLETDYPEADTATVSLSLEAPARFTLRFRIPGWAKAPRSRSTALRSASMPSPAVGERRA